MILSRQTLPTCYPGASFRTKLQKSWHWRMLGIKWVRSHSSLVFTALDTELTDLLVGIPHHKCHNEEIPGREGISTTGRWDCTVKVRRASMFWPRQRYRWCRSKIARCDSEWFAYFGYWQILRHWTSSVATNQGLVSETTTATGRWRLGGSVFRDHCPGAASLRFLQLLSCCRI